MEERRLLPRWEIKKESKLWFQQTQDFGECIIEDLHLKGMCISCRKKLPNKDSLKMAFTIGDSFDFIKIEAQVPWSREDQGRYVYGLSFEQISDQDKERMYAYINANCYDQFRTKWWAGNNQ